MLVETGQLTGEPCHPAGQLPAIKSFEKAAGVPWWQQRRVLTILGLMLLSGAAAAAGVAYMTSLDEGNDSSSSSANSGSDGSDGGDTVTLHPTAPTTPSEEAPQTTPLPTSFPAASPIETPSAEPSVAPTPSSTSDGSLNAFSFFVMGDIPYDEKEALVLKEQIQDMNTNLVQDAVFTVHVGDLKHGKDPCVASYYESVADTLLEGPHPTLVLAGDNDYLDCDDEEVGWNYYYEYFVTPPLEQKWLNSTDRNVLHRFEVTRNFPNEEMFSFVYNGILFLSVSFLRGDQRYMDESVEWVAERVLTFSEHNLFNKGNLRGVVIFGHAKRNGKNLLFFEEIMPIFWDRFDDVYVRRVPVLYIHGDEHDWTVDTEFGSSYDWDLFWDIEVDQGYKAPPILVEVAPALADNSFIPLREERSDQYVFGEGLFRIDRRGGLYDD